MLARKFKRQLIRTLDPGREKREAFCVEESGAISLNPDAFIKKVERARDREERREKLKVG